MATDLLRTEGNERLDLIDFDFMANEGMQDLATEPLANFMTDPTQQRMWIISGFEMSNPAASQLQVNRGAAILATRDGGAIKYGYLTTQGEVTRVVDLTSYSSGTYGIYIRFDYIDGDTSSRIFWNPTGGGSEFASNVPTRRLANWSVRVESSSPGAEWFKIGEVVQSTMVITDQRSFYFEGNISDSYESGWSTDGGGGANDRNADRATYGVKDFQTFTAAIRQSITDIRGRGLREWYEKGIGGINIGFDTNPTEKVLGIGDANNYHTLSGNFAQWNADSGCTLTYDRGNHTWDMGVDSFSYFTLNVANSGVGLRPCELDLFGLTNFSISSDASGNVLWQWDTASYINFNRASNILEFDIAGTERFHIDATGCAVNGDIEVSSGLRVGSGSSNPNNGNGIYSSGLAVGFDANPSASNVEVGDANFRMDFNAGNPRLYMESDSYIGLSRASEKVMSFVLDNETLMTINELTATTWSVELGRATDQTLDITFDTTANLTTIFSGTNDLYIGTNNDIFIRAGGNVGDVIYFGEFGGTYSGAFHPNATVNGLTVGTTSTPSFQLQVEDTFVGSYVASFRNAADNVGAYGIRIQGSTNAGANGTKFLTCYSNAATELGGIDYNGADIQIYQGSDERLKRDIQDTKLNGLGIINALRLIEYRRKEQGEDGYLCPIGFSAQQVQKVFPHMVSKNVDSDSDMLSISPTALIGVLCKAIQELTNRVTQLEGA